MKERERTFEEGHDNILIFDYDQAYRNLPPMDESTLVNPYDRQCISLNGAWHFSPDVFDSMVRGRFFKEIQTDTQGRAIPLDYSFDQWDTLDVPGNWNAQKAEYKYFEGTGLYFRTFESPKHDGDQRVVLHFGAANYEARIWLNGAFLGRHVGGFTPFSINITDHLQAHNRLLVYVNNTRRGEGIPSLNFDWFNYGGIQRDVSLLLLPRQYIQKFQISLCPGSEGRRVQFRLEAQGDAESCKLTIPALGFERTIPVRDGRAHEEFALSPQLWTPTNPMLYTVCVEYREDRVCDELGFREIRVEGEQILLNGTPIFLKGMCAHEEMEGKGRAVSDADIEDMLQTAKDLHCNFLRLTHYPHNAQVAKLADRLGILLWEEIPVYWALDFENPSTYACAETQLRELIARDINRASVIIWSVGNENPDTDVRYSFMRRLADTARTLDDTRLVAASCLVDMKNRMIRDRLAAHVDIIGLNEYYGWYIREFAELKQILDTSHPGKPVIITETGAEAVPGRHGAPDVLYTEECQADIYERQFSMIRKYSYICGITPWILYDYASPRRMSAIQRGINLKGLLSRDRKHRKLAYEVVRSFYETIPENL